MQIQQPFDAASNQKTIVIRPDPSLWVVVGCLLVLGSMFLFFYLAIPKSDPIPLGFAVALCGAALWTAAWTLRSRITADGYGVHWRRLGRGRTIPWAEINDYCIVASGKHGTLEVASKDTVISSYNWTNRDVFMEVVKERAINARVKGWEFRGTRPEDDWPRVFDYRTKLIKWIPAFLIAFLALSVFRLFTTPTWSQPVASLALMWRWNGPVVTIAFVFVGGLVALAQPAVLFALLWPWWVQAKARREESFTVTPHELQWTKGATVRTVPLSSITNYFLRYPTSVLASTTYTVESENGQLEWTPSLQGFKDLNRIVQRYATNATVSEWKDIEATLKQQQEILGQAQTGQRVFTYRTNVNRAMVCFYSILIGMFAPLLTAGHFFPTVLRPPSASGLVFSYLLLLVAVGMWRWYLTAKVIVDAEGIRSRTPLGVRQIKWSSLAAKQPVSRKGDIIVTVIGAGVRIRLFTTMDGLEDLRAIIAEHASKNSQSGQA